MRFYCFIKLKETASLEGVESLDIIPPVNPQEVVEIAAKVKKGDSECFSAIIEEYKAFVFNFTSQLSGSREMALDMTQESFLRVFRQIGLYKPDHPFKAWLGRVVYTTSLNYLRKKRESIHIESLAQDCPLEVKDGSELPEDRIIEITTTENIRKAIAHLSEDLKATLILCQVEEVDIKDAAVILGIPEGTVKSRLFRAKQELREILVRTYGSLQV